jgi:uncharacterized protein
MAERRIIPVADTSFIIAVLNRQDRHHTTCLKLYQQFEIILLPQSVVVETAIGLNNYTASSFLQSLFRNTKYSVVSLEQIDFERTGQMLRKIPRHPPRLCRRECDRRSRATRDLNHLTLDERDFTIVKPAHVEYLTILP